jgi:hypothetical protein
MKEEFAMPNPWQQVLDRLWYYLEEGPRSGPVTAAFPKANRYRYGPDEVEARPPVNSREAILIIDQTGGAIDPEYSPGYIGITEEFQITVWSGSLALARINELRLIVLAALDAGLPTLGLAEVVGIKFHMGRVGLSPDKVERDADGRLMLWRKDLQKSRRRSVLLQVDVTFLIDRSAL